MLSVTASGNLVADPRTNTVGGSEVANFTLLSNSKKGGEDIVSQIDCACWGKRAEVISKYVRKGQRLTVTGTGHLETYESKGGESRAKLSINVADFDLPPKPKSTDDDLF